jgi:hypothetical protein
LPADYVLSSAPGLPPAPYFARMVLDATAHGQLLFDRVVAETLQAIEQGIGQLHFRGVADPEGMAALLTAYSFAVVVFNDHLARTLGAEPDDPQTRVRLASAAYDLYTQPVLHPLEREGGTP